MIVIDTKVANYVLLSKYDEGLQSHLDTTAKSYGYDNINTAISYAEEPSVPKFQIEGKAFRAWRSLFWAKVNEIKNEVLDGERDIPSIEEIISVSPVLDLPPSNLT